LDGNPATPKPRRGERLLEILALIVAEGTGRRLSAWRNLFWDDVAFDVGTIRWRAPHDKKGYEQVVPMSNAVRDALTAARRAQKSIGNTPVFPAPKDASRPCSADLMGVASEDVSPCVALPLSPAGCGIRSGGNGPGSGKAIL
jgi:integrase